MRIIVFVFMAGLSLFFYQNCAPYESAGKADQQSQFSGNGNGNNGGVTEAESITAYELSLAQVTRPNCGACHGVNQAPYFAVPNTDQAHDILFQSNLVNLDNPSASRLVQKIRSGHQNLSSNIANELELAIEDWAKRLSF